MVRIHSKDKAIIVLLILMIITALSFLLPDNSVDYEQVRRDYRAKLKQDIERTSL